jgi:tetratricopeptide (TPR) repeat protein
MYERWLVLCLCLLFASAATSQRPTMQQAARLDSEGKCDESEPYYRMARADDASPALLNNAGNHYLLCRRPDEARVYFERLLKINPAHSNANLQLARLAANDKQGEKALAYLSHVNSTEPAIRLLRAEALHWAGKREAALAAMNALVKEAGSDPRTLLTLGATFAGLGRYDRAEETFRAALVQQPGDFDALFHLGRAAARAQHYKGARSALEAAARIRPADPNVLLELGLVHAASKDYGRAVYLLAQARQRAPGRADILLALARAAEDAGYYSDSALAYDEYLQSQPTDDTVRRDRARVLGYTGARIKEGLKETQAYIARHPEDPVGYYNLAQFTWRTEPGKSLDQLAAALRLDSKFVPAHVSRAWLLHRLGRSAEAVEHLESALMLTPDNVRALDQLGLVYLALDRTTEAEKVLRQAVALAPEDPDVLMHLGRALMAAGREEEAGRFFEKYRRIRPGENRSPRSEPGMIELATLSDTERRTREIERFRRLSQSRPDDPVLQLHLADLLLAAGRIEEAAAGYNQLLTFDAGAAIWEEAGRSLVSAEQYALARQFLERAARDRPGARLDLAIALLHTEGPAAALKVIDEVPQDVRAGDFLLLKARILGSAGRRQEADQLLMQGAGQKAVRPEVAAQAAMVLLRDGRKEALDLVERSIASAPDHSDLLLTRAIVLALTNQSEASEKQLREVESRWPEWDRPYLVHGLLLEHSQRKGEAMQKVKIAVALGSQEAAAKCAIARLTAAPGPDRQCACLAGLREFLFAKCD